MKNGLDVYFIRHNWEKESEEAANYLFQRKMVGIHFDNYPTTVSWDEESYDSQSGKQSIRYLNKLDSGEGLVVASYCTQDSMYIGRAGEKYLDDFRLQNGDPFQLKSLQLKDVIKVDPKDWATLFAIRPPHGPMVQWHQAKIAVNSYYEEVKSGSGLPHILKLEFMSPWQQELMCEEWLRLKEGMSYKLTKTGKSMKDYDIIGVDASQRQILCQVKYIGSQANYKRFVNTCSADGRGYFFVEEGNITEQAPVNVVRLSKVFDYFKENNPQYLDNLIYGFKVQSAENK